MKAMHEGWRGVLRTMAFVAVVAGWFVPGPAVAGDDSGGAAAGSPVAAEAAVEAQIAAVAEVVEVVEVALVADDWRIEAGWLIGEAGIREVWRWPLGVPREDRETSCDVVSIGRSVFAVRAGSAWELDGGTGQVLRRHPVLGRCTSVRVEGERLHVTLENEGAGGTVWEQHEELPTHAADPEWQVRWWVPSQALHLITLQRVVRAWFPESLQPEVPVGARDAPDAAWRTEERMAALRASLPSIRASAARNPGNPWWVWQETEVLRLLGEPIDPALWARMEEVHGDYEHDLVALSFRVRDDALSERLFVRGLRRMISSGYEPEAAQSLIPWVVVFRPELGESGMDEAALTRQAERLAALVPRVEGVAHFWTAMEARARAGGDTAGAARWARLAEDAAPTRLVGGFVDSAVPLGLWFNLLMAGLLVVPLVVGVKTLRTWPSPPEAALPWWARWNPATWWRRSEVVGLILVLPLVVHAGREAATSVAMIGAVAAAPVDVLSGQPGHPGATRFWHATESAPAVEFRKAQGWSRQGEPEAAAAVWDRLPMAEAANNLGVIRWRQGRAEDARLQWEAALRRDPAVAEAWYNLGREVPENARSRTRVERHVALGGVPPLEALPSPATDRGAWAARVEPGLALDGVWTPLSVVRMLAAIDSTGASKAVPWVLLFGVDAAMLVLLFAGLLPSRRRGTPEVVRGRRLGEVLGWLIPGVAPQWGVLGPLVTLAAGTLALTSWHVANTGSLSLIEALATPSYAGYFGIAATEIAGRPGWVAAIGRWGWVPFAVHPIAFLAIGWARREWPFTSRRP